MRQSVYQTPVPGGIETRLQQNPQNASEAQNLRIDKRTGGWSTRVGYEPYVTGATDWDPFASVGPVTSLHVAQALTGGARQHILFEEDGNLHLVYEASGTTTLLRTLATDRHVPAPTEAGSWYTDTAYGTVITNGVDRPVIVKPWPLGTAAESTSALPQVIRGFGFEGRPAPALANLVKPYPASPGTNPPKISGGGAVTLWCPTAGDAVPDGGRWGIGLGKNESTDPGAESLFAWSVSFVTDTGSEGPLSTPAEQSWELPGSAEGFRNGCAVNLPTGPQGVVARKLYRTANYSEDAKNPEDTALYLIDIIRNNVDTIFFDAVRTANLGNPAPERLTLPLPAPAARFSALFAGCMFLDGGVAEPRTLFFSTAGLIEQFPDTNFIELASRGGGITALFPHYNDLLVFREESIDVVRRNEGGGFTVSTISDSVTCRAPHSIATVPGLGVVFLARDGVYALTGGFEGGATSDLINLTVTLDGLIERITPDLHPRAVAVYSSKEREYQLHVPVDGNDRPNLGLVLHLDRLAVIETLSPWTSREGFPVGALATLHDGTVLFGHNVGDESGDANTERGVFVMSGKRALGATKSGGALVDNDPPTSVYRSAWHAFGDPQQQKQVSYVTLWMLTTGQPEVQIRHYKDFSLTATKEATYRAQPPDAAEMLVLDSAELGKGAYREERLVPLRFSVAHQSAAWFCFEIETTDDLVLVGYEYEFTSKGTRVVAGVRV